MKGRPAAVTLFAAVMICCMAPTVGSAGLQFGPTWTIMVYMANDVPNALPWEDNINSMESAPQAFTSVVALLDNSGDGDSVLLKVVPDTNASSGPIVSYEVDDGDAVIPAGDEVDMADPATLRDFIVFSADNFPADRLVLILWGHGDGWHGLCPDKTGMLTMPELSTALGEATSAIGRNLDMVVVDACTQATLEMFAQIHGYVDYFVGAENLISYYGLPYEAVLEGLANDNTQSLEEFGSLVVSEYIDYAAFISPYSATMGAFNLTRLDGVLAHLDEFSQTGLKYGSIYHGALNNALMRAEYYETPYYFDFLDLMAQFGSSEIPIELRLSAVQASIAFRDMMIGFDKYNHPDPSDGVDVDNASGAIIYAPSGAFTDDTYQFLEIASATWDQFSAAARLLMPDTEMTSGPGVSVVDTSDDGLPDTVLLDWPDDYPEVEAYVYRPLAGGLVELDHLTSDDSSIVIGGLVGELVISASAMDSLGNATTHMTVNTAVYAIVHLDIVLTIDSTRVTDDYDIMVTTNSFTGYALEDGEGHLISLTVPNQGDVGEMVRVNVTDPSSGEFVQSTWLLLPEHDTTVTIELYGTGEDEDAHDAAMLAFSVIPGALIMVFAALLYADYRKTKV